MCGCLDSSMTKLRTRDSEKVVEAKVRASSHEMDVLMGIGEGEGSEYLMQAAFRDSTLTSSDRSRPDTCGGAVAGCKR